MSDPIKLSELVAAREGMRRAHYGVMAMIIRKANLGISTDAVGLLATHNAADVLIEIAQAALKWRDQVSNQPDVGTDAWRRRMDIVADKLISALDKVQP